MNPIIIIPARLASVRLPNKPLADIDGLPMIVHVMRRAIQADVGPVVVACGDRAIADAIGAAGGKAVMTDPAHPSGSDRVFEALEALDPGTTYNPIINLQGDLPTIPPSTIGEVLKPLKNKEVDIGTLAVEFRDLSEGKEPNIVKVYAHLSPGKKIGRAQFFSRNFLPVSDWQPYHHVGLYAFRRDALQQFVGLKESTLEKQERLEQLRALEAGMRIDLALVDTVPDGVDTPDDLERVRSLLKNS